MGRLSRRLLAEAKCGFRAFGLLEHLWRDLEAVVGTPVDVVTLSGPFSQKGEDIPPL